MRHVDNSGVSIIMHVIQHAKSILNELTLQKDLQNFLKKLCVVYKKVKTQQQQNRKSNIKNIA